MRARDLVVTKQGATFLGRRIPCSIGRGGITRNKREGDGATPVGVFPFQNFAVFFRPDRMPEPKGAMALHPNMILPDDPVDPRYNLRSLARRSPAYSRSHERMWRADPLYDLVVDIDYNMDPVLPGAGSAIFLHVWRKPRHPTEGCVAFAKSDLLWILNNRSWADRLIIKD